MAKKVAKRVATLPPGQTSMTAEEYKELSRSRWTENQFQQEVITLARQYGFKCAHFRCVRVQRKDGSCYHTTPVQADGKGFPDLVLVGNGRIIWLELKVKHGKLSPEQEQWRDALLYSGQEYHVWRPQDFKEIENTFAPRC